MHGYDSDHNDMKGFFLAFGPNISMALIEEAHLVDVCASLCATVGVNPPKSNRREIIVPSNYMFTSLKNEIVEKDIGQDIESIVSAIKNSGLNFEAIYLVGSFGRGEGSVRFDGSRWRGTNDYDVLVIHSTNVVDLNPLKELGLEAERKAYK